MLLNIIKFSLTLPLHQSRSPGALQQYSWRLHYLGRGILPSFLIWNFFWLLFTHSRKGTWASIIKERWDIAASYKLRIHLVKNRNFPTLLLLALSVHYWWLRNWGRIQLKLGHFNPLDYLNLWGTLGMSWVLTLYWSERSACAALGCWHKWRWPLVLVFFLLPKKIILAKRSASFLSSFSKKCQGHNVCESLAHPCLKPRSFLNSVHFRVWPICHTNTDTVSVIVTRTHFHQIDTDTDTPFRNLYKAKSDPDIQFGIQVNQYWYWY